MAYVQDVNQIRSYSDEFFGEVTSRLRDSSQYFILGTDKILVETLAEKLTDDTARHPELFKFAGKYAALTHKEFSQSWNSDL